MAHYKRKKSRRVVRCTLCTPHRWLGNARGRFGKHIEFESLINIRPRLGNRSMIIQSEQVRTQVGAVAHELLGGIS
jgi:hypothetical protein